METMAGKKLFIDTNVLVYANNILSPFCVIARNKLSNFSTTYDSFWISRQVIREYLVAISNVMLVAGKVDYQALINDVQSFENQFGILEDSSAVNKELLQIISLSNTAGKQIHDANIVATMLTHNIDTILTNNTSDFKRFNRWITIESLI